MSITKMKKLKVVMLESSRESLLSGLLESGCVQISDCGDKLKDSDWNKLMNRSKTSFTQTRQKIALVRQALDAAKHYSGVKGGLFEKRFPVSKEQFFGNHSDTETVCTDIKELIDAIALKETEKARLTNRLAALSPWKDLDVPLNLKGTEHTIMRMGTCPAATDLNAVKAELEPYAAEIIKVSSDTQLVYLFAAYHKDDKVPVIDALRLFGFSFVTFPYEEGTPKEAITSIEKSIAEADAEIEKLKSEIAAHEKDIPSIKLYCDRMEAELSKQSGSEEILTDGTIGFFEGWCPEEKVPEITALLDKCGCAYEFEDPQEEDIPDVPVSLKNGKVADALNMVTEMYSLPSYANVDPNPLMAPFFILFYGIMMADMGYGLIMMIAGLLINKKYAPKGTAKHLFSLMFYCGITTFIMGALTGGFLGDFIPQLCKLIDPSSTFELPSLFTPLDDTMMILIGCMALGLIHIVTGMAISVSIKLRRKEYMSILWNEVTWWLVFAGIALMALGVTNIVLYIAIAMVVVGSGWEEKGFGKVTAIFSSLYNNVTGYFGDILSYSRLMALMLAGSVIASVFNTLGCIPGKVIPFLIISLIGNALNMGLNILGCYVHDLRLQCLEFFNKFYEDGGKPFRPVAVNTKYVDVE